MRESVCGGMFAISHIAASAMPRLTAWFVRRATLWSAAENSVTNPTPTIAIAIANSGRSTRRTTTSQRRASASPMRSRPSVARVVGVGRRAVVETAPGRRP